MDPGSVVCNRFQIMKKIGAGSFGTVYSAVNLDTGREICLKVESVGARRLQLMNEARILRHLQGGEGVAVMHSICTENNSNVLAMELLGPSLEVLLKRCKRKLSLKTVLQIGLQMIDRIQYMHAKCYIHRDIKPDNFCMGLGAKESTLYIVDFGLAKKFMDTKSKLHLMYRENKSLTGTARYASLHSHQGLELSRRDDIESIAYNLIYLIKGSLPWQGIKASSKIEKYNKIAESKAKFSSETACSDVPTEFLEILSYSRSLRFEQSPDYGYLTKTLTELARRLKITFDLTYDWPSSIITIKHPNFSARSTELSVGSKRHGSQGIILTTKDPTPVTKGTIVKKKRRSSVGCCSPSRSKSKGSRCMLF
mmetsp:Transcript_24293/g.43212  ORF Transcript_24293/g.43212 Transcript_24293/m.43212 type:complete len:366 (-) Transcript_24293:26-1123(-)